MITFTRNGYTVEIETYQAAAHIVRLKSGAMVALTQFVYGTHDQAIEVGNELADKA